MKRVWRNLSKGKKIAGTIALVICLMVVAVGTVGYLRYHKQTAQAGYYDNWQLWTEETPNKNWDLSKQAGTEQNPFVVMEIVPWVGNALWGIQTENCESFEMTKVDRRNFMHTNGEMGVALDTLFEDEFQRALEVDYKGNETEFRKRYSEYFLPASDLGVKAASYSAIGYYEKVAPGTGDFIYTGNTYADSVSHVSSVPIKTKVNGQEQTVTTVYRPEFRKVGKNQGDWKWETLGEYKGEESYNEVVYMSYIEYENKYTISPDQKIVFKELGDREYTVRTDSDYRKIPSDGDETAAAAKILNQEPNHIIAMTGGGKEEYIRYHNTLVRTGLHIRSEDARANFHMAIKIITPQELNAHPEWIDYADLMYMHESSAGSGAEEYYEKSDNKKVISPHGRRSGDAFTAEDDFTWGVASMLFQKANGVGRYASTTGAYDAAKDVYNFAPLITSFTSLNGAASRINAKDVKTYRLDYGTLEPFQHNDYKGNQAQGYNSNVYKLRYMSMFMDPQNFYKMFFTYDKKSGGTVIPAENIVKNTSGQFNSDYTLKPEWFNKDGACTSQGIAPNDDKNAEIYWNEWTFMPMDEFRNFNPSGNCATEFLDHFGINYVNDGQSVLISPTGTDKNGKPTQSNVLLNGGTFMYNSGSELGRYPMSANFDRTTNTEDAFKWYEDSENKDMNRGISPAEMIHYLLNYNKGGNTDIDQKDRDKIKVNILEIEPCNDYLWKSEALINAFFPASRFETEVTCMTSQEFNGREPDFVNDFDLVYMGLTDGKFNHKAEKVEFKNDTLRSIIDYNDAVYDFNQKTVDGDGSIHFTSPASDHKLAGKYYLHVGDLIKDGSKTYRFSGNDLSSVSNKSLKKYINQNRGIVVMDNVLINKGAASHNRRVDSSSYIHNLVCQTADKDNVQNYNDVKGSYVKLSTMLFENKSIGRSQVEMVKTPAKGSLSSASGSADASANMEFKFALKWSELDEKYNVTVDNYLNNIKFGIKFYIDVNNDGIIKNSSNSSTGEMVYDSMSDVERMKTYCDGKEEFKSLKSQFVKTYLPQKESLANPYTIDMLPVVRYVFETRRLARRSGALSWKFVLYDTDHPDYEITTTGVGRYQATDKDADENAITFYQIMDDASQALTSNSLFNSCMGQLQSGTSKPYSISDDSISVTLDSFMDYYNDSIKTKATEKEQLNVFLEENPDYPSQVNPGRGTKFDVIIVSCSSSLQAKANPAVISYLQQLSEDGVGVIFAQGSVASSEGAGTQEKATSQRLKEVLNQSRFTSDEESIRDLPYYATGKANVTTNATSATMPIVKPNLYTLNGEQMEYTYATLTKKGDDGQLLCFDGGKWKSADGSTAMRYKSTGNAVKTDKLTRINQGKITTFPFDIPENISIHKTEAQDFQLNMHNDDVRVWYCLGGEDNSMYGISPNDATNNYYIYTVDNLVYTSADFKEMNSSNAEDEMKLFINTLVFSYDSSSSYPRVVVTRMEGTDPDAEEVAITNPHPNFTDTEQYLYFLAGMKYTGKSFQDYVPGARRFTPSNVNTFPDAAGTPEPIEADPTDEPVATVAPTATPEVLPDPIDLSTGTGSFQSYDAAALGQARDNGLLVVKYHLTNPWGNVLGDAVRVKLLNSWENGIVKQNTVANATVGQELTIQIPMSEIKAHLGNAPLQMIIVESAQWCFTLDSAILYHSASQFNPPQEDSNVTVTEAPKVTLSPKFVKQVAVRSNNPSHDTYQSYMEDMRKNHGYTHKVYFKPVDNTSPGGKIQKFRVSIVKKPADEYSAPKIEDFTEQKDGQTVIRQDVLETFIPAVYFEDATGRIFRYKASSKDATFSVDKRNYVEDGKEYFFLLDDYYRDDYLIQFEITNLKKTGYSYLDPKSDTPTDNTYLFDLD